MRKKGI